jgi:hypothetical protein
MNRACSIHPACSRGGRPAAHESPCSCSATNRGTIRRERLHELSRPRHSGRRVQELLKRAGSSDVRGGIRRIVSYAREKPYGCRSPCRVRRRCPFLEAGGEGEVPCASDGVDPPLQHRAAPLLARMFHTGRIRRAESGGNAGIKENERRTSPIPTPSAVRKYGYRSRPHAKPMRRTMWSRVTRIDVEHRGTRTRSAASRECSKPATSERDRASQGTRQGGNRLAHMRTHSAAWLFCAWLSPGGEKPRRSAGQGRLPGFGACDQRASFQRMHVEGLGELVATASGTRGADSAVRNGTPLEDTPADATFHRDHPRQTESRPLEEGRDLLPGPFPSAEHCHHVQVDELLELRP